MRKLLIMRGAPGSGKSQAIAQLGLEQNHLSMDSIRLLLSAPELSTDGRWITPQDQNERVFDMFIQLAGERMRRGETLALDAIFASTGILSSLIPLISEHGYDTVCLDFSGMPQDLVREYNQRRVEIQRVPEKTLARVFEDLAKGTVPQSFQSIAWQEDGSHIERARDWLAAPALDLSSSQAIVFIGDLQGCLEPLVGPGGPLEHGFDPNTHYVFLGDLLDRGPENGQLMRWFIDNALDRDNVSTIYGNHETHPRRWAMGLEPVSEEFRLRTLPQLIACGVTPQEAGKVVAKCHEALIVSWHGQKILVTHAGLPTVPQRLELVSGEQLTHGTGMWEDPIDAQFERHAPAGWTQVHGHRNHGRQAVLASANSINLEDGVEKGGCLRWATLDSNGWKAGECENTNFLGPREQLPGKRVAWAPQWMKEQSNITLPQDVLAMMREHPGVLEKASKSFGHVASLNFTREVFFERSWDDVVVKARGLFFDKDTLEVVARGYNKFFNVGEREETRVEALAKTLKFPVSVYVKENGFLGNIGYDRRTNQLFVATKSTPDGDFAGWFREIFNQQAPNGTQHLFKRFLRDYEACAVFEVIDPVRDPHMVDYDTSKLVLLDIFHRSHDGKKLAYDDLRKVGARFGFEVKQRGIQFKDMEGLSGWMNTTSKDLNWKWKGQDVEGFVLEDASGYMTKIKLPNYSFWKRMRSVKDRVVRLRNQEEEIAKRAEQDPRRHGQALDEVRHRLDLAVKRDTHPLALAFGKWCMGQPAKTLEQGSIIQLRKAFETAVPQDPTWKATPWAGFDEEIAPKPKALKGP
jgi:predicted kinase/virulence-associated protein VapD